MQCCHRPGSGAPPAAVCAVPGGARREHRAPCAAGRGRCAAPPSGRRARLLSMWARRRCCLSELMRAHCLFWPADQGVVPPTLPHTCPRAQASRSCARSSGRPARPVRRPRCGTCWTPRAACSRPRPARCCACWPRWRWGGAPRQPPAPTWAACRPSPASTRATTRAWRRWRATAAAAGTRTCAWLSRPSRWRAAWCCQRRARGRPHSCALTNAHTLSALRVAYVVGRNVCRVWAHQVRLPAVPCAARLARG